MKLQAESGEWRVDGEDSAGQSPATLQLCNFATFHAYRTRSSKKYRTLIIDYQVLFVFVLGWVLWFPMHVQAHGGGIPFVTNEPLGEFVASVWLNPSPLETGAIHVTVGLAKDESVVLNQRINVMLVSAENGTLQAPATHENAANRFFYEADLEVANAGDYMLIVEVEGQTGYLETDVTVQAPSWTRSPWVGFAALGIVALIWVINRGGDAS